MNNFPICGCCGGSPFELRRRLAALPPAERVAAIHADFLRMDAKEDTRDAMIAMLTRPNMEAGRDAMALACLCVQFLLVENELRDEGRFRKRVPDVIHPNKYISLWSFVYDYFGITKDSGYDYLLLCWMEANGIIEHGCAIRCPWLTDELRNAPRIPEIKELIARWAEAAPDNI